MRARTAGSAILVSMAVFAALILAAMHLYPGGTWFDRQAPGHDPFRSFLCDLTQPVALNGRPNPIGSSLAKLAMLALSTAILVMFVSAPRLAAPSASARVIRASGTLSYVGQVLVPLTPSLELGAVHAIAVLIAVIPGLLAGALSIAAFARARRRGLALLGAGVFAVAAVDAVVYANHVAAGGPTPLALPILQRIALVLLVAWAASIAVALLREDRSSERAPVSAGPRTPRPAP